MFVCLVRDDSQISDLTCCSPSSSKFSLFISNATFSVASHTFQYDPRNRILLACDASEIVLYRSFYTPLGHRSLEEEFR